MFEQIGARLKGTAFKSWLKVAGVWGLGLLPCPECGAPLLLHSWPVALAFTLVSLRRGKGRTDVAGLPDAVGLPDATACESKDV